ncbi:chemotaxis protein CheC [Sporolactobacillus shoreicorticis]|uniref:Chemotaxis protein CheC n=1 Tax=Sporolactobacillus shoreicorticis TaxID=1923877 RepID=A0ABW5S329_9BACL|nr:chemotaxis protein CheC [Sporolactobacillus shoreicorticis]MCO7125836.1 chemotaxis protein CheC [Sporolactobacillus shoreicorticis]
MADNISREDILTELFNVGVGQAASTLSDIIDKRIGLTIPNVRILDAAKGKIELNKYLQNVAEGAVMVSSISFNSQLEGKVSLLFPADKMHHFIDLCLHETRDEFEDSLEFTDIDFDTIKEIGNIVINSIIGELSNAVNIPVEYTLPDIDVLNDANAEHFVDCEDYRLVLMMFLAFDIEGTEIGGAIVINMTLNSLDDILNKIDKLYNGR